MPPHVVLGVAGGIAAYKVCELLRGLTESGHDVQVVPTESALHFVGAATWEALSGHPVSTSVWNDAAAVPHVRIGRAADVVVVAPATADLLACAAHGLADDLLTNTLLTATCPVVMAPAMHTEMWLHPATQANVALLRSRGVIVLDPAVGRLTGADTGPGRLPEPEQILEVVLSVLAGRAAGRPLQDLAGRRVVVSAGGTREPLDPVRYLSNRSSGRQGLAIAAAAVARGAEVTLLAAHLSVPVPAGLRVVPVGTTRELRDALLAEAAGVDAVVMAAAPADFRPASVSDTKIKKTGAAPAPIQLETNPDALAELCQARRDGQVAVPVIVGFAAETGDATGGVVELGRAKLARKGCDLLVVNDVGPGGAFESVDNAAVLLGSDGSEVDLPKRSKRELAHDIWDAVAARLP
ncbi:MAG: bifunctional phosphopantothenoylcysteine decarboxylase/phosphopantothenate--cysteine ligase CoaBC [Actinomycetales bacterium]